MAKIISCGIVPLRKKNGKVEMLLGLPSECAFRANSGNVFQGMGFLKGHVEDGETNLETAKREFSEESGELEVELFDENICFNQNNPKKNIYIWPAKLLPTLDNEYKITEDGTVLEHDSENMMIKFYPVDDLPAVFRNQQKILAELLEFVKENEHKLL